MRLLFISGSKARLPDPVYPLGPAIVATAARRAGHEVSWFDALRHKSPAEALAAAIDTTRPEVVMMSIRNIDSAAFPFPERYFEDHTPLVEVIRKKTTAPIVLGGSGFSLMPELFMDYLGADIGIAGDGEEMALHVLDASAGRTQITEKVIIAPPLSGPFLRADRDLFDADWYYQNGGVANVQTKRGCPLKCIYCTYPNLEGDAFRKSDPTQVAEEIAALCQSGIRHFFFVDTAFNASESHAAAVCEEIIRRDLDISFAAYLIPRVRLPEFPSLLKRAGCTAAEFGTDALTDEMLTSYKKGFTVSQALDFSDKLKALEIPQCHNLILGGPGETPETMEVSVTRMDKIDPTAVILTIGLRIFPDTELSTLAANLGVPISGNRLEPTFYIEERVQDTIVEKCAAWVEARRGWICPGLGKRYNPRYLERLRRHRKRKGPLWTIF
jgi:radical SAM superfamily enzyme YgiQ (UPF0313 family)